MLEERRAESAGGTQLALRLAAILALCSVPLACRRELREEVALAEQERVPLENPVSAGPAADNSRCHVCHINYDGEELAVEHARAGVGCERCHGPSDAHCSDENNVTPPDVMYPEGAINPACMKCHVEVKAIGWDHGPLIEGRAAEKKRCTDCHGEHRLAHRTRRWDKETGKLIADERESPIKGFPPP